MPFSEEAERKSFVPILSTLVAGPEATAAQEESATPKTSATIPIHADFAMGGRIIAPESTFSWSVGAEDVVSSRKKRNVYVHLPITTNGKAKIHLDEREDAELSEGDGAFISGVNTARCVERGEY
ncbi:hypothetical protein Asppvi_005427 [Aspergillus pseudoviridinutans]|uniref:Uncharacterized protein n=1 Tax=Aspergillus pseudoviridinutans TaxID=1517512 RepID=A0A9P3BDW9_9EURO|nr:uncharacterized protein Asppvi_005427 [Aspergillus pseudoviridinutans]GIJ86538.1 hypothetical protein Asppvi_005427 [Aspergillus pseudoviridinutans]